VAITRPAGSDMEAFIGLFSYQTKDTIVIEAPNSFITEIPKGHGVELRKIAFCRF
jgi:hypothetical protein